MTSHVHHDCGCVSCGPTCECSGSCSTVATIPRVPRPRGDLTPAQLRSFILAENALDEAQVRFRAVVVKILAEGASFSEVSKATGLSTNTLQRWKREASA